VKSKRVTISVAILAAVAILAIATMPIHSSAQKKRATITIKNKTDWDIHHLYLTPADDDHWGPDQLGDDIIKSGSSYTIKNIPCDSYDIKIIDHDGDACVIEDIDLCKDDSIWTLTNKELLKCQGWGE
jgi:hypothetical protein